MNEDKLKLTPSDFWKSLVTNLPLIGVEWEKNWEDQDENVGLKLKIKKYTPWSFKY